jgi:DNA ligase-1
MLWGASNLYWDASMHRLAAVCEAIAGTRKKNEKVSMLADYLGSRSVEEAAVSAMFLSGRPFAAHEESTLQVGGALLWRVLLDLSGKTESELTAAYRKHGDLGAATYDVLVATAPRRNSLSVIEVEHAFRAIAAARRPAAKGALIFELLSKSPALEAKYLVKIMTGELRIGLKESLVEEAIARAYGADIKQVQRANMLLGSIGETLRLAAGNRLGEARMRLFHPIGFMLASPVETAEEAFSFFEHGVVEDKYDGIRAQAHAGGGEVKLFSRTLDQVTDAFPELVSPLAAFPGEVILDGEVVAWSAEPRSPQSPKGQALPFSELQKRLGRKKVTETMMRAVPVTYVAFDVLYAFGELVIDKPLRERAAILDRLFAESRKAVVARTQDPQGKLAFEPAVVSEDEEPASAVIRCPSLRADSPQHLDRLFDAAQARGNEGLMIKDLNSVYTPGRRGRSWVKLKRELATLDVVVTIAEYGHGKRAGVLSDYTFAVRDPGATGPNSTHPVSPNPGETRVGHPLTSTHPSAQNRGARVGHRLDEERLLNVGKAYSGLTDKEIDELTGWFLHHTVRDHGFWREVEPRIVLEVAFNAVMRSDRHDSGYALRFPRILRIRWDKRPEEVDTIERVAEIYQRQKLPRVA